MATVVSTSKSQYAGKSIKTLSDGSKVRVSDKTGKSGVGSSRSIDTTSQAGLDRFAGEIAADTQARAERAVEAPVGPVTPTTPEVPTTAPVSPTAPVTAPTPAPAPVVPQTGNVTTAAASPTPTQNKYQAGLAAAQAGGATAPQDGGAAASAVTSYMPPQPPDTTAVDQFMSQDPSITTLMKGISDLLNPQKQTSTLMQDYKKLYKQSGLDDINEELIDADTVINGTEDDIRNEIQTAGGFGTESQVQAMTLSRNKGLLKRYNQLVQMKTDATNQLNTMMSLTQEDKKMAQQRVDSNISAMFNMANFRQTALQNTRSQYQWLAQQQGADGLYNSLSQDPRQLALTEKILGVAPGGLQKMATQAATERASKAAMDALDIQYKKASISNIYSQINERNKPAPKSQTPDQFKAQTFGERTNESDAVISKFGSKFAGAGSIVGQNIPGLFKSSDRKQYEQAQRNFINSVLRRESGASIAPDEFDSAKQQYFPQAGDSTAVILQKSANRQTTINGLYREAGAERQTLPGQLVQGGDGVTYQVGSDGQTLTKLKI